MEGTAAPRQRYMADGKLPAVKLPAAEVSSDPTDATTAITRRRGQRMTGGAHELHRRTPKPTPTNATGPDDTVPAEPSCSAEPRNY